MVQVHCPLLERVGKGRKVGLEAQESIHTGERKAVRAYEADSQKAHGKDLEDLEDLEAFEGVRKARIDDDTDYKDQTG